LLVTGYWLLVAGYWFLKKLPPEKPGIFIYTAHFQWQSLPFILF
jgi:hypothetical protein